MKKENKKENKKEKIEITNVKQLHEQLQELIMYFEDKKISHVDACVICQEYVTMNLLYRSTMINIDMAKQEIDKGINNYIQ